MIYLKLSWLKEESFYGRGSRGDDKGPLMAGLLVFAKIINFKYSHKMKTRVIFGCNEELGSNCVKYIISQRCLIPKWIYPDAAFPVVYGEKAGCGFEKSQDMLKKVD